MGGKLTTMFIVSLGPLFHCHPTATSINLIDSNVTDKFPWTFWKNSPPMSPPPPTPPFWLVLMLPTNFIGSFGKIPLQFQPLPPPYLIGSNVTNKFPWKFWENSPPISTPPPPLLLPLIWLVLLLPTNFPGHFGNSHPMPPSSPHPHPPILIFSNTNYKFLWKL